MVIGILMLFDIVGHLQLLFEDVISRRIAYTRWKRNVKWFERTDKGIIVLKWNCMQDVTMYRYLKDINLLQGFISFELKFLK